MERRPQSSHGSTLPCWFHCMIHDESFIIGIWRGQDQVSYAPAHARCNMISRAQSAACNPMQINSQDQAIMSMNALEIELELEHWWNRAWPWSAMANLLVTVIISPTTLECMPPAARSWLSATLGAKIWTKCRIMTLHHLLSRTFIYFRFIFIFILLFVL